MPAALPAPFPPLVDTLAAAGLNVVGVVDVGRWDAVASPARRSTLLLPGAQSILVFGSGGPGLWRAFLADLAADPRGLTEEEHPLDAYVRRVVARADTTLGGVNRRWFQAAPSEPTPLDFRLLASLGGLGTRSRPGLLLHPVYGLWLGLRAACFVDVALPPDAERTDAPCDTCPSPCIPACPGAAFVDGALSIDRCAAHNRDTTDCVYTCHARAACPEGAAHRYPPEEQAYHTDRARGRAWLRAHLGLPAGADRFEGVGPFWTDWRSRVDVTGSGGADPAG